jgi:hypothetical protein
MRPHQRLGSRSLQKRARLRVNGLAQEVVIRCVADVETDRRVECDELDEVALPLVTSRRRRCRCKGFLPQFGNRPQRLDAEDFRGGATCRDRERGNEQPPFAMRPSACFRGSRPPSFRKVWVTGRDIIVPQRLQARGRVVPECGWKITYHALASG